MIDEEVHSLIDYALQRECCISLMDDFGFTFQVYSDDRDALLADLSLDDRLVMHIFNKATKHRLGHAEVTYQDGYHLVTDYSTTPFLNEWATKFRNLEGQYDD